VRARWIAVLICTTAVWAMSGCGSDQPVGAVNVAKSYLHDLADARYDAACALFTDDLRRRLGDVTTDATPAPGRSGKPNTRRTVVRSIAANHALNGKPLTLQKAGAAWLISDVAVTG